MKKQKLTKKQIAAVYGASVRTVFYSWPKMHPPAPIHNPSKMPDWAAGQPRLSDKTRSAIAKLSPSKPSNPDQAPSAANAEAWIEFMDQHGKGAVGDDHKNSMAALTRARDFASFQFEKAAKANDRENMRFFATLLQRFEGVIHDAALRAARLKLDTGDLFPRSEIERVVAAWCYHAMRCVDGAMEATCRRLVGVQSYDAARRILEPVLLDAAYVEPFKRAVTVATGNQMPAWFVETMIDSVGNFIENGETQMRTAIAAPAPAIH